MKFLAQLFLLLALATTMASCSTQPKPIPYGSANCVHCNMTVADNRFGAELVNEKGKPYFFDSAECLMAYINQKPEEGEKAAHVLVTDYTRPNTLTDARSALFLQSKAIASPMGMHLVAVSDKAMVTKMQQEHGGRVLSWDQALLAVQKNERPQ